jgi:hypothetical protein
VNDLDKVADAVDATDVGGSRDEALQAADNGAPATTAPVVATVLKTHTQKSKQTSLGP